ncbi:hypothetical protein D3273_24280 [Lichenibacterium minor]|uniref:Uncharacterized protein n=1 Tax=Lichenibacterium minor TaxID=2316528 RepID=A0A4Q2TZ22_9HYPH|nr:hypothetical protein [Lichenibacterium minor]RYC29362.1 hypothetical protein D3273_24280 [Lichenibacterium minor]
MTVDTETPARPPTAPCDSSQCPVSAIWARTTPSAAASPIVNRAAMAGGIHPEAVQALRRSMLVLERGRLPTRLVTAAGAAITLLAAIASHSSDASSADSTSAPNARHTSFARASSPARGDAITARRHSSTNILCPSSGPFSGRTKAVGKTTVPPLTPEGA